MPPAPCANLPSSNVALRDCPTMIPMTAPAPNATNNEQLLACSPFTPLDDNTLDSLSVFIHKWNIFYNKFIQSMTYWSAPSQVKLFDRNNDTVGEDAIMTVAGPNATEPFNHAANDNDTAVTNASDCKDTNDEKLPSDDNTQESFSHFLHKPAVFTFSGRNTDAVDDKTVKQWSHQQAEVIDAPIIKSQPLDHKLPHLTPLNLLIIKIA